MPPRHRVFLFLFLPRQAHAQVVAKFRIATACYSGSLPHSSKTNSVLWGPKNEYSKLCHSANQKMKSPRSLLTLVHETVYLTLGLVSTAQVLHNFRATLQLLFTRNRQLQTRMTDASFNKQIKFYYDVYDFNMDTFT
jgi:hypothetical protein